MEIKPTNYNLSLTPDFKKFTFHGKEILTFEVAEHHHELQLDCADIVVEKCSLLADKKNAVRSFRTDVAKETLHIEFANPAPQGKYQLEITYHGVLNDQLKGFYRSKYAYKGKEEYVLTTQFEPTEAHRAFPCVDSPSAKATFDLSFIIPKEYTGISNMLPVEEKPVSPSAKLVRFETTPVMSPYLLYFGIGKWEIIERRSKNDVLIRGITTPEKSKYTEFSLEVAEKCLDYFADYFDYPYILPKLDLLAIPDFASGAMENWGAVTFREILLLYYHGKTSKAIRERIAEVICHELAHQWFGNLVTMKWFDDIWLNESFATYMAFKALHHIFPQWDNWQKYVTDTVFEGMALDSLHSTHPIHVHDVKVKDIDELFDEISYDKGGGVLRMVEGYLGGEKFQKAIQTYIRMFQYQNTVSRDLWDRFEEASGDLTAEMIEKFIMQPGFPLITAQFQNKKLRLQQERFLFLGADKDKLRWDVPLVLQHKNHESKKLILTTEQTEVNLPHGGVITLNKDYTGFYISSYTSSHFSNQSSQGRVGALHDLYYLVLAGKQNLGALLDFIEKNALKDTDPYVSQYVAGKLFRIYKLTKNEKAKEMLNTISKQILTHLGHKPQPEEKLTVSTARNTAIASLVLLEDDAISTFVEDIFQASLKDETALHKDLKGVIYASAVWIDDKNYPIIHKLYRKKEIQEEKIKLLSALGNAQDPKRIEQTLNYILTDEVRLSDYFYPIVAASVNPKARGVAYRWLVKRWKAILQKLGLVTTIYMRKTLKFIVPECAIGKEQEINQFLHERKIAGLEKTYTQVLEELEVNARFVRRFGQAKNCS